MDRPISRRTFLAASSALAVASIDPGKAQAKARHLPSGPVYGRVGRRGLGPGTADRPSIGEVVMLDGRTLTVQHEAAGPIAPGKSVWLSPTPEGSFSVLYAEV